MMSPQVTKDGQHNRNCRREVIIAHTMIGWKFVCLHSMLILSKINTFIIALSLCCTSRTAESSVLSSSRLSTRTEASAVSHSRAAAAKSRKFHLSQRLFHLEVRMFVLFKTHIPAKYSFLSFFSDLHLER